VALVVGGNDVEMAIPIQVRHRHGAGAGRVRLLRLEGAVAGEPGGARPA
jgi:hypothetical protein